MARDQRIPELALAGIGLNDLDEFTRKRIEKALQFELQSKNELSDSEKEKLVVENLDLAFSIAGWIASFLRLPYRIETRDLAQDGAIGLVEAAGRYRKNLGVSFRNFAFRRVRGAIYDRVKKECWPRTLRLLRHQVENARRELKSDLGREPSVNELGAFLGYRRSQDIEYVLFRISTIESFSPYLDQGGKRLAFLPEGFMPLPSEAPDRRFEKLENRRRILKALLQIPPRERQIILMYYYAGMTNEQIAAVMGFNYSRASQLRTQGIRRLRSLLG